MSPEGLDHWITWLQEHPFSSPKYPPVDTIGPSGLWEEEAEEHGRSQHNEKTLATFMDRLAATPADFNARFVAIHYYWSAREAAKNYDSDADGLFPSEIDRAKRETDKDLRLIIRALPVEEVPADWDYLIWEISNARLVGDGERALALYRRAEELGLRPRAEIQAIRGYFRMAVVLWDELQGTISSTFADIKGLRLQCQFWTAPSLTNDDQEDSPDVHERMRHALRELELALMFRTGMAGGNASEWRKEWCEDAATDLGRALVVLDTLPDAFRVLRARAEFLAGKYQDAANWYQELLSRIREPKASRLALYNSIVLCYEMAEDSQSLKVWLTKKLSEFADERGIHTRLAQIESESCNLSGALEHLRQEVDSHPEEDVDWKVSLILATSETSQTWNEVTAALKQFSPSWEPITHLLCFHWPGFARMSEGAQDEWVAGMLIRHFSPASDRERPTMRRKAALSCATALEIDLREKVFRRFKERVASRPQLRKSVTDSRDEVFRGFLLDGRLITLGEMAAVLERCSNANEPTLRDFYSFLTERAPKLKQQQSNIVKVARFRNPAAHSSTDIIEPDAVMGLCRMAIESLSC